ncbi:hypothetical protein HN876_00250 [archaeon]|jgi:hypothetical protein|nr:hypothetical protein [archaeon]
MKSKVMGFNRSFIILLAGLFISISLVDLGSAVNSCGDPNDVILKLYSNDQGAGVTNTHAEEWNGPNYDHEICYSDIFGAPYAGANAGPTVHDSTAGTNRVLNLAASTNSHAEGPGQSNYPIGVFYGDLSCNLKVVSCANGEFPVVNLGSATNAHLEDASLGNYNNFIVCCSTGPPACNNNGVQDGDETGIDCGGATCPACASPACDDGVDNDADGFCDLAASVCTDGSTPGDPGCTDLLDNDETDVVLPACDDGVDNDADGFCDLAASVCTDGSTPGDPGCTDANDLDETDPVVGSVIWADLSGTEIFSADQGDTVQLIYTGVVNHINDFEIFEEDTLLDILDGGDVVDNSLGFFIGENSSNNVDWITTWDIPVAGQVIGDNSETNYEMYFEIDDLGGVTQTSIILDVPEDSDNDDPIDGDGIIDPACGTRFNNLLTVKPITFNVFDRDSRIDVTLTVTHEGASPIIVFSEQDIIGGTFITSDVAFDVGGTSEIRLFAENDDGDKFSAISNVIVVNPGVTASYFAACIDEPVNFENIGTDYAHFNASSSSGYRRYGGACGASCSTPVVYAISPQGGQRPLYMDWTFSDGRTHEGFSNAGMGINWKFYKYFGQYGDNWADLTVSASP